MKTLLDENIHARFKPLLIGIEVYSVYEKGWDRLKNGELRKQMEQEAFEAIITADKNFPFQQNLSALTFIIIILDTPSLDFEYQQLFLPKIQEFLSNPPDPLPKIVHVSVEGITKGNKKEQLQKLLPADELLFL
jgi:hypothetical protein